MGGYVTDVWYAKRGYEIYSYYRNMQIHVTTVDQEIIFGLLKQFFGSTYDNENNIERRPKKVHFQ